MSWKPSSILGSVYRFANPTNATDGRISRFSGLKILALSARTVSLCSQSLFGVIKCTQRMGSLDLAAREIHFARISVLALVLSGGHQLVYIAVIQTRTNCNRFALREIF